jgi:hypothetical protein
MEEIVKAQLEGVYREYIEYRDYYKSIYKTPEERRDEIAKSVETLENKQNILDLVFELNFKYNMHEKDMMNLLTRLYHTVVAYQDIIEIPQEVKKEVENFKMIQAYTYKNGEEKEINKEENKQLKELLIQNYDTILKQFGEQK